MRYFQIKTLDIEMVDIERWEGEMQHHRIAATSFEVEAERRREVISAGMRAGRSAGRPGLLARFSTRVGTKPERVGTDRRVQAGKLDQKRA